PPCVTCAAPVCGQTPVSPPHSHPHSSHLGAVRSGVPRQGTLGWQLELDDPELLEELLLDEEDEEEDDELLLLLLLELEELLELDEEEEDDELLEDDPLEEEEDDDESIKLDDELL